MDQARKVFIAYFYLFGLKKRVLLELLKYTFLPHLIDYKLLERRHIVNLIHISHSLVIAHRVEILAIFSHFI